MRSQGLLVSRVGLCSIWDLMKRLAHGRDHVLGRPSASRWWQAQEALDLISGRLTLRDPDAASKTPQKIEDNACQTGGIHTR